LQEIKNLKIFLEKFPVTFGTIFYIDFETEKPDRTVPDLASEEGDEKIIMFK